MATGGNKGPMRTVLWLCTLVVLVTAAGTLVGARGCEAQRVRKELQVGERVTAVIKGKTFRLEPAIDDPTRVRGLGGRDKIEPDGGMVFVFPIPQRCEFVMRDCLADIDIAFLDDSGHVLTIHAMKANEPRNPGEDDRAYEMRLKRYPSRYPTRVAVEVAGGTFATLGLKEGDLVEMDLPDLKARAR